MSLSRSQKILTSLLAPALMLVACQANVSVQPSPSPTPTATPFPTATPMPTPTPGWSSVTITPTRETNDAVLAEVRRLEAAGQVTGVAVMESYPVQIRLNGSAETIANLQDLALGTKSAAITAVKQLNKTLTVHYRISAPDPNAIVTQVLSYPAHIVSIPLSKSKGDFDQVDFVEDK